MPANSRFRHQCLIAVGCNQGDCDASIQRAIERIGQLPDTSVGPRSSLISTQPAGAVQGTFLNGAIQIQTDRSPDQVMIDLLAIERLGGRDRKKDPGNRPIDLDMLLFGQQILNSELLQVPHPRMSFRQFVLQPAAEIAGDWIHPTLQLSISDLYQHIRSGPNIIGVFPGGDSGNAGPLAEFRSWASNSIDADKGVAWSVLDSSASDFLAQIGQNTANWNVVVITNKRLLFKLDLPIKLLIETGSSPFQTHNDGYQGPRWNLELAQLSAAGIRSAVQVAIQSMG